MAPHLQEPWAPFLLGRTSRSLFLTLKGWPEWTGLKRVQISLPGCRSCGRVAASLRQGAAPPWQQQAVELLAALLGAAADPEDLEDAAQRLNEFLANR